MSSSYKVKVTLLVQDTNNPNMGEPQECSCLSLGYTEQAKPEFLLEQETFREKIRQDIAETLTCEVKDKQLEEIIKKWIRQIREGYTTTTVSIALSPKGFHPMESFPAFPPPDLPPQLPPIPPMPQPKLTILPPLVIGPIPQSPH